MSDTKLLNLTIAKVDEPIFSGEAVSVLVPGVMGQMEIMAGHTALISPLKAGTVTVKKTDGKRETHQIESGTLEVANNHATVLI